MDIVFVHRNSFKNILTIINKRYKFTGFVNKRKEYTNRKLVGFSRHQMFEVIADVKNYYKFLPFCQKSDILVQHADKMHAKLRIGFPPIVEEYTSNVLLVRPIFISSTCFDGKIFNYLDTRWKFQDGLTSIPNSCVIDFFIIFEFKSLFHAQLSFLFFEKIVMQMENAFITEAMRRYGKESVRNQDLKSI